MSASQALDEPGHGLSCRDPYRGPRLAGSRTEAAAVTCVQGPGLQQQCLAWSAAYWRPYTLSAPAPVQTGCKHPGALSVPHRGRPFDCKRYCRLSFISVYVETRRRHRRPQRGGPALAAEVWREDGLETEIAEELQRIWRR